MWGTLDEHEVVMTDLMWPLALIAALAVQPAWAQARVDVELDTSQAETALAIMDVAAEGPRAGRTGWRELESSRPYQRLKQREASLGVGFTDAEFQAFLTSPEQLTRRVALADALRRWNGVDIQGAAGRAFEYLPEGARLKSDVYFLIKPKPNSFVWDLAGEPGVFLYLDPTGTSAQIQNTIAHELHHVGMAQNCGAPSAGADGASLLRRWSGAFAEGLAMLAAAGGAERHPHADSEAAVRAVWDENVRRFDIDLRSQDAFFTRVLAGEAGDAAAVGAVMREYYGEQGPWYTVGWMMAQIIEQGLGKAAVVDAFCRPGEVFTAYNEAARRLNAGGKALPLWSEIVVAATARPQE